MSDVSRWRDSGYLERAVETTGGQDAFDAAVAAMLDAARGWRLAEMRKAARNDSRAGRRQDGCIGRPGVPDRERRCLYPNVLSRFVAALGGTLKLIATSAMSSSSSRSGNLCGYRLHGGESMHSQIHP